MNKKRSNPAFLNGVPELLILQLLARRPVHGYELVQAIKAATQEQFEFGEGCIYPILHRLEAQGMLQAEREQTGGRSRLVYRVTARGQKQLRTSVSSWQRVVQTVNHVLQGGDHGRPALA